MLLEDAKSLGVSSLVTFDSCHLIAEVTTSQVKTLKDTHTHKSHHSLLMGMCFYMDWLPNRNFASLFTFLLTTSSESFPFNNTVFGK